MKIGFFGCSFTEGGGLNSPVFNEYAIKNNLIPKEYEGEYEKTRKGFRYSTLIGKDLNCEVENFGKGCSSNEYIFNQLYKHHEKFDICVVQLTIYSRRYQWDEHKEKFEHINDIDNYLSNLQLDYLGYLVHQGFFLLLPLLTFLVLTFSLIININYIPFLAKTILALACAAVLSKKCSIISAEKSSKS